MTQYDILCAKQDCRTIATFWEQTPMRPECRTFYCEHHRPKEANPLEDIELLDANQPLPLVIIPKDFSGCEHYTQVELDAETRTVSCVKCGKQLDPFQVLAEFASNRRLMQYRISATAERQRKAREEQTRKRDRYISKKARDIGIKGVI